MKSNGKVKISARKDLGTAFAIHLLVVILFVRNFILNGGDWYELQIFMWWLFLTIAILVGMRDCLIVDTEKRVVTRKTVFSKKTISFDNIDFVEVKRSFLLKTVRIITDDGKVFDKTPVIMYKDCCVSPDNFITYFSSGCNDRSLLLSNEKLDRRLGIFSKVPLTIIALLEIGIFVPLFIDEMINPPTYPIVDIKFYNNGLFRCIMFVAVAALIGLLVKNRFHPVTDFITLLLFFGFIPMSFLIGLSSPEDYYVSATRDFANYDEVVNEELGEDYDFFPKEIQGEITDFSYYHKYYWDEVTEVYLEVKYDDEEFDRIYCEYGIKESSYLSEKYEEVNLTKEYFDVQTSYDGENYISFAIAEKVIFDKENNTVIYYSLLVIDPFYIEWCYFVQKYDIDILHYEEYIEHKSEDIVEIASILVR